MFDARDLSLHELLVDRLVGPCVRPRPFVQLRPSRESAPPLRAATSRVIRPTMNKAKPPHPPVSVIAQMKTRPTARTIKKRDRESSCTPTSLSLIHISEPTRLRRISY